MPPSQRPTMSVLVTTYNHEKYIKNCIQNIFQQQTSFDFEVVVGEDHSTDSTLQILNELKVLYGSKLVLLTQPRNTGGAKNFRDAFEMCRADLIAWCEGDDYWTDPNKLEKQFRVFQSNPNCKLVFTRAQVQTEPKSSIQEVFPERKFNIPKTCRRPILCLGNLIPTVSTVFRKSEVEPLPDWYSQMPIGDWTMYLLALRSERAEIQFIDEVTCTYLRHQGGQWSQFGRYQSNLKMLGVVEQLLVQPDLKWSELELSCLRLHRSKIKFNILRGANQISVLNWSQLSFSFFKSSIQFFFSSKALAALKIQYELRFSG